MIEFAERTYGTAGLDEVREEFLFWEEEDDEDPDGARGPGG